MIRIAVISIVIFLLPQTAFGGIAASRGMKGIRESEQIELERQRLELERQKMLIDTCAQMYPDDAAARLECIESVLDSSGN